MMRISRMSSRLMGGIVLLVLCGAVQGDVIFSNFGPGDAHSDTGRVVQGENVGTIGDIDQASTFEVGASDHLLTSVTIGIWATRTGPIDLLIADNVVGTGPGAVLRTLPVVVNSTGKQTVTAFDAGTFTLNANTMYWVIADGKDTYDGSWTFNTTNDMGFTAGRTNNGPWNLRPVDEQRLSLRVEGRVVPEPGALGLLGVGSILLVRRRR